jgi:hypothetical protein
MHKYREKPKIEIIAETTNGDVFKLARSMVYFCGKRTVKVPKGFASDGASVPQFLWSTVSPKIDHRTLAAAILHDFLYRTTPHGWTRWQADLVFVKFCRLDGLNWWRSFKAWLGVRLFGASAWNSSNKGGVK